MGIGLRRPGVFRARTVLLRRLHNRTKPTMVSTIRRIAFNARMPSIAGRYLASLSMVLATSDERVTAVVPPVPSFETL